MILKTKSQHLNPQLHQVNLHHLFDFLIKFSRPFNFFSLQCVSDNNLTTEATIVPSYVCKSKEQYTFMYLRDHPSINDVASNVFLTLIVPLMPIFTKYSYIVSLIFRGPPSLPLRGNLLYAWWVTDLVFLTTDHFSWSRRRGNLDFRWLMWWCKQQSILWVWWWWLLRI